MTKKLKLSEIVTDAGTQVRAGLNETTVTDYAEALADGAKFPPVVVFHDGRRHLAADGFHRIHAARKIGATHIECDVRRGSKMDALKFALGCNAHHGLRRTNADKRHAVAMALKEFPKLSDRALAEMCLVGHDLVSEIRKAQLAETPVAKAQVVGNQGNQRGQPADSGRLKIPPVPQSRVGLDGRERRLPPPPMVRRETNRTDGTNGNATPHPESLSPIEAEREDTGGTRGATKLPPPPSLQVLDATGWPIPTQLIPLWRRGEEVQEMLTALSRVKGALRTAQETKDLLYAEVMFSSALSQLDQAWTDLKRAKPFSVCPTCQGQVPDKCTLCRGRGLISEFKWSTCVTREDKEFRSRAKARNKS